MLTRSLLQRVELKTQRPLAEYEAVAHLAQGVHELRSEAAALVPRLSGRTVWMVNSTAQGGGVAEMLLHMVPLLRELGVRTEWVVIGSRDPAFFPLTKRIHNLIHGAGRPDLHVADRDLFERVNRENAEDLKSLVRPGDFLIVHDPQPLPLAGMLREHVPVLTIWRSHIGLDEENVATRAAWEFLGPYLDDYDHAVFSAPEYIPERLAGRSTVIYPGIDPLSDKNCELSLNGAVQVLCAGGLVVPPGPTLEPPFPYPARRVLVDGRPVPANAMQDIGLLTRPIVTQVSRWDRLKGFRPLMEAFASLKQSIYGGEAAPDPVHRRRLELARLVLAGPEVETIQDDPEATDVLEELQRVYASLPPAVRHDIAIVTLPMHSKEQNALLVNVLQRASTIVVQNSLREGFGLTVAEAMWKRVPVLSNTQAVGPRTQIRDGLDGRLIDDPSNREELGHAINEMLALREARQEWGRNGQRRVHELFLVTSQLRSWGNLLGRVSIRT